MQLVISADRTNAAISAVYVKVTYTTTGATWLAAEDAYNGLILQHNANVRLRLEVANEGSITTNRNFLLEYGRRSTTCDAVSSWTTVPATATTEDFQMITTHNYTNGDATTAQLSSDGTFFAGLALENPSNSSGVTAFTNGTYTEYEFAFEATSTAAGTYCFRVSDNGTSLDSYSSYAQIFISPPLSSLLHHGAWFADGEKQPFTF
jgi:hypothetical protein